ncbi:MAG: hypothetical protein LBT81_04185 [Helicobacteraceae bacterium]|jgi:hypothetical protein|nr:hypothetical protein [Helicobacteraceae bacterium]
MKRLTRTLTAAFLLTLPVTGFAAEKYAVELPTEYWQLIGVGGLFQLAGEGGEAEQNPDFSAPGCGNTSVAVVDIADSANHISWDGNISSGGNQALTSSGDSYNFISGATVPENVNFENPLNPNTGIGLPYHSVLGVRAIAGADGADKAVVVIGNGIRAGAGCKAVGKDYSSPIRTMYVVSPYAGAPDVAVFYQALYEGEPFKISFKNSLTDRWGEPSVDRIYLGTLNRANTYDKPARVNSELALIVRREGSSTVTNEGALNQVICVNAQNCAFTNNIERYISAPFSTREAYEANRTVLNGDLALYRYAAVNNPAVWEIQTFSGDGATESTTSASNLNVLTPGYGYWARYNNTTALPGQIAGLLLQENIEGRPEFYNGKLAPGWNLLAFDDARLRHTTSGVVINSTAATPFDIISPFGDINVSLSGTDANAVAVFNQKIKTHNDYAATEGSANRFNIYAYVVNSGAALISDKPFYIGRGGTTFTTTGLSSLAGRTFDANEAFAIANGVQAVSTKLGEYAVVVERNKDYNITSMAYQLGFGLAHWVTNSDPGSAGGMSDTMQLLDFNNTNVGFTAGNTDLFPTSLGAGAQVLSIDLDVNVTTFDALLFAATERFFVREETSVRVFDLYWGADANHTAIEIVHDGSRVGSVFDINSTISPSDGTEMQRMLSELNSASGDYNATFIRDTNNSLIFVSNVANYDIKEYNATHNLLLDRYPGEQADVNNSVYGPFLKAYQASALTKGEFNVSGSNAVVLSPTVADLTYAAFWADDFPSNGPIYYMTANGYTPEMFISAETADINTTTSNAPGTISWKALDVTRNPAEWFDPANGFELFWTEKERGYWVYLSQGFENPVGVSGAQITSTSRVYKHFNLPAGGSDVYPVFNWFNGSLTARVRGLVRPNYTSGQSYNVQADINGERVVMTPTGPLYASGSDFTAEISDFSVSSLRPIGAIDATVTASDGLGGRSSADINITYVQPATPTLTFSGNTLTAASDPNAKNILLFNGHQPDTNYRHIAFFPATAEGNASFNLSEVSGITYPAALLDIPFDGAVADENNDTYRDIVKELLVGASTGAPDVVTGNYAGGTSVYSNLRRQFYLPVYSGTAHLKISAAEQNATKPVSFYNLPAFDQNKTDYGVQFAYTTGVGANIVTVVFQPKDVALSDGGITHVNLYSEDGDAFLGELGYIRSVYEGEAFYVYVIPDTAGATGSWYYGVFQGDRITGNPPLGQWGIDPNVNSNTPYKVVVRRVDTRQQL